MRDRPNEETVGRCWIDRDGVVWRQVSYTDRPTASFRRLVDPSQRLSGVIGSYLLSEMDLVPVEYEPEDLADAEIIRRRDAADTGERLSVEELARVIEADEWKMTSEPVGPRCPFGHPWNANEALEAAERMARHAVAGHDVRGQARDWIAVNGPFCAEPQS